MLVLTRKADQTIQIGEGIRVTVLRVRGGAVRIGIDAPRGVKILRGELTATPQTTDGLPAAGPALSSERPVGEGPACDAGAANDDPTPAARHVRCGSQPREPRQFAAPPGVRVRVPERAVFGQQPGCSYSFARSSPCPGLPACQVSE